MSITVEIAVKDAMPGDVLHVVPASPHRRHIITSLYALDANVILHLEGLGAFPFDPTEKITVDRKDHGKPERAREWHTDYVAPVR